MGTEIWGLTFAESADSPWMSLREDFGYGADESVLIKFGGHIRLAAPCTGNVGTPTNLLEFMNASPELLVNAIESCTENSGFLVFFTPDTAREWENRYGFETVQQLQDYLYDNALYTKGEWSSHYAFYRMSQRAAKNERGIRKINPDHLDLPDDALIPILMEGPESVKVIVAGGGGNAWGWGTYFYHALKSTSIDKWR